MDVGHLQQSGEETPGRTASRRFFSFRTTTRRALLCVLISIMCVLGLALGTVETIFLLHVRKSRMEFAGWIIDHKRYNINKRLRSRDFEFILLPSEELLLDDSDVITVLSSGPFLMQNILPSQEHRAGQEESSLSKHLVAVASTEERAATVVSEFASPVHGFQVKVVDVTLLGGEEAGEEHPLYMWSDRRFFIFGKSEMVIVQALIPVADATEDDWAEYHSALIPNRL